MLYFGVGQSYVDSTDYINPIKTNIDITII